MNQLTNVIDWMALLKIVIAGLVSGGVGLAVINWIRHRPEDAAKAKKTQAEADEIEAKRAILKTERDEKIFDLQEKLVVRLSQECEATKKELDTTIQDLQQVRANLIEANKRCKEMEDALRRERENNKQCFGEIEQLKIELEKLKREDKRSRGPN
jgi:uncharacterized coiled-coil DUF342 family protein